MGDDCICQVSAERAGIIRCFAGVWAGCSAATLQAVDRLLEERRAKICSEGCTFNLACRSRSFNQLARKSELGGNRFERRSICATLSPLTSSSPRCPNHPFECFRGMSPSALVDCSLPPPRRDKMAPDVTQITRPLSHPRFARALVVSARCNRRKTDERFCVGFAL